jgi:nitroreductase
MPSHEFERLPEYEFVPVSGSVQRSAEFLAKMCRRRSVRQFSNRSVPREVIVNCVATAGTAPSGANLQPWHFVIVEDASVKQRIRSAAEQQEREFYDRRASKQWLEDLAPLGTGPDKPFLEDAPFLVAVLAENRLNRLCLLSDDRSFAPGLKA